MESIIPLTFAGASSSGSILVNCSGFLGLLELIEFKDFSRHMYLHFLSLSSCSYPSIKIDVNLESSPFLVTGCNLSNQSVNSSIPLVNTFSSLINLGDTVFFRSPLHPKKKKKLLNRIVHLFISCFAICRLLRMGNLIFLFQLQMKENLNSFE